MLHAHIHGVVLMSSSHAEEHHLLNLCSCCYLDILRSSQEMEGKGALLFWRGAAPKNVSLHTQNACFGSSLVGPELTCILEMGRTVTSIARGQVTVCLPQIYGRKTPLQENDHLHLSLLNSVCQVVLYNLDI